MNNSSPGRTLRIGHRGAAGHAPENTVAAIEAGVALGVDFVELDVQKTRDGQLVILHDKTLDRTTNGSGPVASVTWSELQQLDAGQDGDRTLRVPSLQQALAAASGRAGVILECITPGLGQEIFRAVQAAGFDGPVLYSSFLHAEIVAIRNACPNTNQSLQTMALLEGVPVSGAAFAEQAGASHAGLALDSVTPALVSELQQHGIQVFVYTANDAERILLALALGVDGIISDFPELIPQG